MIEKWQKLYNKFASLELCKLMKTINSYLGMAIHLDEFDLRFSVCELVRSLFVGIDFCFSKINV